MATINDVYSLACNAGYIDANEFSEQAFGDMLKDKNNRRTYYEHVKKLDPNFYSRDYDTFSANVDRMLGMSGSQQSAGRVAGSNPSVKDNPAPTNAQEYQANLQNQWSGAENNFNIPEPNDKPYSEWRDVELRAAHQRMVDEGERVRQQREQQIKDETDERKQWSKEHPVRAFFRDGFNSPDQNRYIAETALESDDARTFVSDKERLRGIEDELGRRAKDSVIPQAKESTRQSEEMTAKVRENSQDFSMHQKANIGAAEYLNTKANEILNAGSKFDDSKAMANWWEGLKNDLDRDVSGIMGAQRAGRINGIVTKLNKGEELTDDEAALLNAYINLAAATEARQFDLSTAYQIGQGTAQSVPFMVDMILTHGGGALAKRGVIKALAKTGSKHIATAAKWLQVPENVVAAELKAAGRDVGQLAETTAKRTFKEAAKDFGRKAVYETIATPAQTVLMPSSWEMMLDEAAQTKLQTGKSELSFLDKARIFTNAAQETLTERAGGELIDWGLGRAFGAATKPWHLGGKGQNAITKYIQSPIGETAEEYLGALLSLFRSYNPLYDDESNQQLRDEADEMFTAEGLGKTFGTVLPMSLVGGAVNMGELRYRTREMDKARGEIIRQLTSFCGASEEEAQQIMDYTEGASTAKEFAERLDIVGTHLYNAYENMGYDMEKRNEKGDREGMGVALRQSLNDYAEQAAKMNGIVEQFSDRYDKLSDEEKVQAKQALEQVQEQNMQHAAREMAEEDVRDITNKSNNYLYCVGFADGMFPDADEAYIVSGNVAVKHNEYGMPVFDKDASEDQVVAVRIIYEDKTSEVKQLSINDLDLFGEPQSAPEWVDELTNRIYQEMLTTREAQKQAAQQNAQETQPGTQPGQAKPTAQGNAVQQQTTHESVTPIATYRKDGKEIAVVSEKNGVATLSEPISVGENESIHVPTSMLDGLMQQLGYEKAAAAQNQPQSISGTPLSTEQADAMIGQMEQSAEQAPQLELTPENWISQFGEDGIVETPIGKVKMGENQFIKLFSKKRGEYFGMIRPTLNNPDVILEETDPKDGAERDSKYLFIKSFVKSDGSRIIHFESVTVRKDGLEVSISSHELNDTAAKNKMQNDKILHLNEKLSLSSEWRLTKTPGNEERPDLVPTSDISSERKGTENNPNTQENPQKNVPFAENLAAAPRDKMGRVDYRAIKTSDELAKVVTAEMKGNKDDAKDFITMKKKAAEKAKKSLKHKSNEDSAAFLEVRKKEKEFQALVSMWDNALTSLRTIRTAEEQAAYDAEQAQKQAAREARKQVQAGTSDGSMASRYASAPKIDGNAGTITAANGQVLKGHYVLVSADGLTPSHDARNGFEMTAGYPTVDGHSINDRDYKNDPEEQAKVRQVAQQYNGNAIKNMPIVSDEGLVYNGNGRIMAGQLAAQQGTDGAYRQALEDNAAQFGFTPEQVVSVPNARVVFQTEERLPYNTTTLAMFNATEQQAQSNTSKAAANTRKLTPESVGHIINAISGFENTDAFFTDKKAPFNLIDLLIKDGILSDRDKASLIDGNRLSGAGKDVLTSLLFGTAFDEQTIRLLADSPQVQNSVMRALPQIIENKGLGELSLFDHINNAIAAIYDMREKGMSFYEYTHQTDIYGATAKDNFSAFELLLADEMMSSGVSAFRDVLTMYNERARQENGGQSSMFGETVTRENIENEIVEYYKKLKDEQRKQKQSERGQGSASTQSAVASTQGSDVGRRGNAENARDNGRRQQGDLAEIQPIGVSDFGDVFDAFIGKPAEAIAFLKKRKSGEAIGALYHPEIGDIDLVWGYEGTGRSDGFGLAKLVKYHPEVVSNLQGILSEMVISSRSDTRIQLESSKYKAAIRLTWDVEKKTWLLTAFEKESSVFDKTTDTTETINGKQDDTALPQNTASSARKGTKKSATDQTKSQKNAENLQNASGNEQKVPKSQFADNKIFKEDAVEAARRRMRERMNRLNAGLDPEMMSDGLIIAGAYVESGVRKFADFAKRMISEFGDKIRPYLKAFYNGLRDMPEVAEYAHELDNYNTVSAIDVNTIIVDEETKKDDSSQKNAENIRKSEKKAVPLQSTEKEYSAGGRSVIVNTKDYHTYITPESKEVFAELSKTEKKPLAIPECAYIHYASIDSVKIPADVLLQDKHIKAAQAKIDARSGESLQLSDEQIKEYSKRLLDKEHGSAVLGENGKIRKRNGEEDFSGEVARERKALFVIGRPAGGKSSVYANPLSAQYKARIIDSDVVKPWLDGYEGGDGAGYVQEASDAVARAALENAITNGDNIVIPKIGGESIIKMAAELRQAGYDVELYYNEVSEASSIMRAMARFAETGRYLSIGYLLSIKDKPEKTFKKFANKTTKEVQDERPELFVSAGQTDAGGVGPHRYTRGGGKGQENSPRDLSGATSSRYFFSRAEWKSNDVRIGEPTRLVWSSESDEPIPGTNTIRKRPIAGIENMTRGEVAAEIAKRNKKAKASKADIGTLDMFSNEQVDAQGNPINEDGTLRVERVGSVDEITVSDFTNPTRNIELPTLPQVVQDAIFTSGKPVVIKKNVLEKNRNRHRDLTADDSREILKNALYDTHLYGQNQKATRPYNWIVIHLADKGQAVVIEISPNKDNCEIVNWHYLDAKALKQKESQAIKEGGRILTLSKGNAVGNTRNDLTSSAKVQIKSETTKLSDRKSEESVAKQRNTHNNHVGRGVDYAPKSTAERIKANIAAIKLLKQLQDEGRQATEQEKEVLRKFTGWGGLGEAFKGEPGTTYYSYGGEKSPYQQLQDILTPEELEAAQLSRNSAYYTPANVIDTLWDVAVKCGFRGGNVLEGSAGIGEILARIPSNANAQSNITAVEIDPITGGILQQLYPDADVHIDGFQNVNIPNNSQDLVITNVPFVRDLHVTDKVEKDITKKFGNSIQDFCIAKNILKLRKGGIGIFIAGKSSMDSSKKLRAWIVGEAGCDVVGAFRLNKDTFGGTGATADIIVVKKRANGIQPSTLSETFVSAPAVSETEVEVDKKWNSKTYDYDVIKKKAILSYNALYQQHPEWMGGEMRIGADEGDTRFGGTSSACYPKSHIDQQRRLADWAKSLQVGIEDVPQTPLEQVIEQAYTNDWEKLPKEKYENLRLYTLMPNSKGEICRLRGGGYLEPISNNNKVKGDTKEQVLKGYNRIKQAISDVLSAQTNSTDDKQLKKAQAELNAAYDVFVSKYGQLNKNVAIAFLRNDIDFSSVAAIEQYEEIATPEGKQIKTSKTDIFSKRVVGVKPEIKPTNITDAIVLSMQQFGGIHTEDIAKWLGKRTDDVVREIVDSRLGFEDPQTGQLQVRHVYLSGNVREKLRYAQENNEGRRYNTNIEELQKVIPQDIPAHLIGFSIGSTWFGEDLFNEFLREKYALDHKVRHIGGVWVSDINDKWGKNTEKNRAAGVYSKMLDIQIYGSDLFLAAMNNTPIAVQRAQKNYDGRTETVTDKVASQACATRIDEIKDEFTQWARDKMQQNPDLAERMERLYNERFNAIVPMEIDSRFTTPYLSGMNPNVPPLYDIQQKAVVRATMQPTLFAHEVGTGKTRSLICSAMEMRRLGTAKKPMIVVQNATVMQFVEEAKNLYPNAKVLTVNYKDRTPEGRKFFYSKIKYNDWDIIIVPQSVFNMMPDSDERKRDFIQAKIEEKEHAYQAAKEAGLDKNTLGKFLKELGRLQDDYAELNLSGKTKDKKEKKGDEKKAAVRRENAKQAAEKMVDRRTDNVENFDDMGIDALLVDEAHNYKHLGFSTMMQRGVKGIDPRYSERGVSLYLKCQAVFEKTGHKNVVFATGTPISNTAAEVWTFMKYLIPEDVMRENEIYYFDDFVRNFGKINQSLEFATNGKFKENTRFASYMNIPELARLWGIITDTRLSDEVKTASGNSLKEEKIPLMENGKPTDIFLEQSRSLVSIMNAVRAQLEKFENMSGAEKRANTSLPLTMYGIAKRAAIDPRLVDDSAVDEAESKTNKTVEETLKALDDSKDYKGTVAIFCDNYRRQDIDEQTNKKKVGFNIYDEIQHKLVKAGVPSEQIAIMQPKMTDTAKQKVFDAVNDGEIRVVLGSTETLGTGVNIQTRLFTLIHMDAPDRPMDMTQREGRILRQGNMHKTMNIPVRIIRLGVKDSLDVTAYQRLKTKSQFIDSVMRSKYTLLNNQEGRTIEEDEEGLYDNPVAVLSGSQYAMLKSQAEREYRKWYAKKKQYEQDQIYINSQTKRNKLDIQAAAKRILTDEKRLQLLNDTFAGNAPTNIVIDGMPANSEEELKTALKTASKKVLDAQKAFSDEYTSLNEETRAIDVPISLDGLLFTAHIAMRKTSDFKNGKRVTMVKRTLSYSSIPLSIENEPVANNTVDLAKVFDEILTKEITGEYAKERIQNAQNLIDRKQKDNEEMAKRFGKPFEYDEQLAAAKAKVEEYTEKMREEMAEKEERYKQTASNFNLEKAIDREVNSDDDDESEAQYAEMDYDEGNLLAEQQVALDAVMTALDKAGIEVEQVSEEEARTEFEKGTTTYKSSGTIYGYAKGGKIYLTPKGMNPNTPIHEYAHLWAKAMQHNNPQGWKSVVWRMKGTPMWEEVANDPRYQSLSNEDAIASEVLARYSGKRGAERMAKMAKQMLDRAETRSEVAKTVSLIQRVKKALQDFWKWVGENLFDIKQFSSAEEVADRVLYDLLNGTDIKQQSDNSARLMLQIMEQGTNEQSSHPISGAKTKKKSSLDTEIVELLRSPLKVSVVSREDGAKIQKKLETTKQKYKINQDISNAVSDIGKALGATQTGGSQYVTIEAKNGNVITIRISNHNATVSNFDKNGEKEGISLVISRKPNNGITNDGDAHITEFFYSDKKLRHADGTPIAEIIQSIEQTLYSGEYKDPTGLAQVQEVNIPADTQAEYSRIRPDETLGEYAHRIAEAKRKERENEKAEFSIQPNETLGEYAHRVAQAHQQKKLETAFKKAQLAATISPHDALPAQQKADAIADYLSFTFGDEYQLQVLPTTDKIAEQLQALGIEEERAKKIETFLAYKNRARGTMIDGTIFAFANRIGSISDAKDVYIHERQHVDNEEYDLPEQLMQDISPEDAVSLLRMLKPNAHRAYADMYLGKGRMGHRMLLDELIAYAVSESMQFAPNTPVQYLQARGITNQQLLNIINNECRRHRFGQSDPRATKSIGRVRTQGERGRGTSPDMRTSHAAGRNEDNRNQPPLNISDAPTPDADETRGDYVARFNMWYNAQRSADAEYDYVQAMKKAQRGTEQALQHVADRYRPLQKFQEYILSKGGTIRRSEQDADGNLVRQSADAYKDTTLATGRAGYQIQRFASHQLKDMVDAVAAIINSHKLDDIDIRWNNVDTYFTDKKNAKNGKQLTARELVGIYAQAKDCQEAIEQELPDRGKDGFLRNLQDVNGNPVSHTEVIRLVEGALEQEQINNLWQSINAATQFSLDYQLRNGMIDQATYDQFHRNYYVPERGWRERDLDGREDGYTEGRGTQLNGNPYNAALKKARGRDSIASDPFAYIQSIAETTILSTERNNVKQKFLQMLLDNEEIGMKSGAWKIRRAYVVRVTDSNGEAHEVVTYERPKDESTIVTSVVPETMIAQRTRDERLQHRVAVMRNGQQYIIELQDEALANALNSNFKEAQWLSNSFANVMRKGVRYMSAINTQYNPAFAIWNLARDLQIGIVNNAAKESGAFQARFLKNIAAVQPVIMQYVWNDHMKGDENFGKNEELSRYLQEYFESGAQTGFSYMQDVQTLSKEFDKLVKGDSKAKRALEATTDFMSMATELSELTVRFAEFATARQMGFTTEEAAAKAKEISVNFDRKGLLGGTFSGLYSFFNATIQGTLNILRGLKTKRAWIAYLSIAGVYAALGVINTLLNPDDPDDDIFFSDYERQTNFLIGKIKLPVTHFFRMFFAAGVNITLMGQGKKTGKQTAYDIVNFVLDEIVPASVLQFHNLADYNEATNQIEFAPEKYAQAISPSYISPFTDVMLNRDFKGATVHREPFITADKDKFKRVSMEKRNTPEIYHDIAYGLHRLSGGNPDVKTKGGSDGLIDINANDLQHIFEGYAGGTGKFVGDLVSLAIGAAQGEFDVSNVPVVNRAFRPYQQERAYTQQYWLLKNRVDHYNALLKDTRENDPEEYRKMTNSDLYDAYLDAQKIVGGKRNKPTDDGTYTADQVKELMKLNVQWNKAQ